MNGALSAEPLYPQYCFHLSPTINKWCPLKAADIEALHQRPGFEGQDVYFHLNHPIKWVRITGVVVAINEYASRRIYTVDDSSGTNLECVVPLATLNDQTKNSTHGRPLPTAKNPKVPVPDGLDIGHIVDVKGGLKMFREQKQIHAEKVLLVRCTEQEILFWEKIKQFKADVLSAPWALDRREVRRCRKEAEGIEDEKETRKKRRRAAEQAKGAERSLQDRIKPVKSSKVSKPSGLEKRAKPAKMAVRLEGKYDALGI